MIEPEMISVSETDLAARELFETSLTNHSLPSELTSPIFIEVLDHPEHYPTAAGLLGLFRQDQRTTYFSEYHGQHLPPQTQTLITARYQAELPTAYLQKPINYPLTKPRSPRLQTLCAAHAPDWQTTGQQLYYLLAERVGPSLHYRFDLNPPNNVNQPGDFHLITAWLVQHLAELMPAYIDQQNVATAAAQISRFRNLGLNHQALSELLAAYDQNLGGPVNLEATRIKKGKITGAPPDVFPRAGATSITRQFESLFVNLDAQSLASVKQIISIEDLDPEGLNYFSRHMGRLRLLLLSLIQDQPNSYKPIDKLSLLVRPNLPYLITAYRHTCQQASADERYQSANAIDPELNHQTIAASVNQLLAHPDHIRHPGFGAARGLLVCYTNLRLRQDPLADQLEQLMQHFNRLATDPTAIEALNLSQLFEP